VETLHFNFDGEQLRIRTLGKDSGVRDMGRADLAKWVLESRRGGPEGDLWVRESACYLPNGVGVEAAYKHFGFSEADLAVK